MTHYILHGDLSCCRVGERLVLLDVRNDRYFRLSYPMEKALTAYFDGIACSNADISALVERSILVEQAGSATTNRPRIEPPIRSVIEALPQPTNLRTWELMEVFAIVLITKMKLKISTLKRILDGLAADRSLQTIGTKPLAELSGQRFFEAVSVFRRARLYVPVEMRCLLDSLAMERFLLRRRIHAQVVFGVALNPFSAHCWVQMDNLVLNDTLGNVTSYTPIRVV